MKMREGFNDLSYLLAKQNRSLGGTTGPFDRLRIHPATTTIGHEKVMAALLTPDPGQAILRNTAIQKPVVSLAELGVNGLEDLPSLMWRTT